MATSEGEYNPKRQHVRIKEKKKCILRVASLNSEGSEAIFVETLDHSKGGLGIIYDGEKLSIGNRFFVYIDTLNISSKAAEIVWLRQLNGNYTAGLRWL
ncbi:MAG: PilZ domain-containing protein [Deltaproteobacteria bacterium]|nr:PilZ domain-containing protein [Deltaproteobacteria bacterium]